MLYVKKIYIKEYISCPHFKAQRKSCKTNYSFFDLNGEGWLYLVVKILSALLRIT